MQETPTALPVPAGSAHQVPELDGGDLGLQDGPEAPEEVRGQGKPVGWGAAVSPAGPPALPHGGSGDQGMYPRTAPRPQGPPTAPACPSPVDLGEHLLLNARLLLVRGVPAPPRVLREVVPDEMQLEGDRAGRDVQHSPPPHLHPREHRCPLPRPGQLYLLLPAGVVLRGRLEEGPGVVGVVVNPLAEVVADVEAPGERGGEQSCPPARPRPAPRSPQTHR